MKCTVLLLLLLPSLGAFGRDVPDTYFRSELSVGLPMVWQPGVVAFDPFAVAIAPRLQLRKFPPPNIFEYASFRAGQVFHLPPKTSVPQWR